MKINTILTDVDGVFTDGKFVYTAGGKLAKVFGPHDSDGIKLLKKELDINVHAISADKRGFEITKRRMDDMGIPLAYVSEADRLGYFKAHYDPECVAFVGDGYFDAPCLQLAQVSYAPKNACERAKRSAKFLLNSKGGEGVFLEIYEHLLIME